LLRTAVREYSEAAMKKLAPLLFIPMLAGCPLMQTQQPSLYENLPVIPGSMCLSLLVRDGLGLPTVKENHMPAAVKIALPRRLERLATVDLQGLGLPPGVFLDKARLAPYSASSGALMPLHSAPGTQPSQQFMGQLSELLSRMYAESMGASSFLGQGLTVSPVINTFSGNLFVCSLDASALWKGLNVMVYRVYNGLQRTPGPFGVGWSHSFASRLDFNADMSVQYTRWDGSRFCYKSAGPDKWKSPEGFEDSLSRSGTGHIIRDRTGLYLLFDGKGRLTEVGNRLGYRLVLEYDGELLKSVKNMGMVLSVDMNKDQPEMAEGGPGVAFAYDEAGRITSIHSTSGGRMDYQYDQSGRLWRVTSNTQQTVEYRYDAQGRLADVRRPLSAGQTSTIAGFVYDEKDRISAIVDAAGNPQMKLYYRWAEDRATQIELGVQHSIVTDRYDERGVLDERIEVAQSTDPTGTGAMPSSGNSQRRACDVGLDVVQIDRQDGSNTRWSYDATGRMTRAQDSNGQWVEMAWDDTMDAMDYIRESGGTWVRFTYGPSREIADIQFDDGSRFKVVYDTGGVPRELINATGMTVPLDLGMPPEVPKQLWEF